MKQPNYSEFNHFGNQVFSQPESEVDELIGCKISGEPQELENTLTNLKSGANSKVLIYIVANGGDSVIKMP